MYNKVRCCYNSNCEKKYKDNKIANESIFKKKADYTLYREKNGNALMKFKFQKALVEDFKENLMPEIEPLL